MPESFFYKLRKTECSTIASAFNLDLNKIIRENKINKDSDLDNKRKALKDIFKNAPDIQKYLETQYLNAREKEKTTQNSTSSLSTENKSDELKPHEKKFNLELDPSRIRTLISEYNKKSDESKNPPIPPTNDASTSTSGLTKSEMNPEQLDALIRSVKSTSLKPLTYRDFSGLPQEDISEHIENFERIAKINKWEDSDIKVREYTKYLKNGAYDFFLHDILKNNENIDWETLTKNLKEKYVRDEDDYELVLSNMSMSKDEDPTIFAKRVERMCLKINPKMSATAIISKICQRVSPGIRKELLHRNIQKVEDLHTNLNQIHKNRQRFKDDNDEILNALKAVQQSLEESKEKKNEPVNFIPQSYNQPKPHFNKNFPQNPNANFPYHPVQQNPFTKFSGYQAAYYPTNQFPNSQFSYPPNLQRRFPNKYTSPNFQQRMFQRPNYNRPQRNNFSPRPIFHNNQLHRFPPRTYSQAVQQHYCTICQSNTHSTNFCSLRNKYRPPESLCYSCGKTGHISRNCRNNRNARNGINPHNDNRNLRRPEPHHNYENPTFSNNSNQKNE